jgi:hypothetical protein
MKKHSWGLVESSIKHDVCNFSYPKSENQGKRKRIEAERGEEIL